MSTVTPSTKWRLRDVVDDASLTGSVRIVAHALCKQRNRACRRRRDSSSSTCRRRRNSSSSLSGSSRRQGSSSSLHSGSGSRQRSSSSLNCSSRNISGSKDLGLNLRRQRQFKQPRSGGGNITFPLRKDKTKRLLQQRAANWLKQRGAWPHRAAQSEAATQPGDLQWRSQPRAHTMATSDTLAPGRKRRKSADCRRARR